MRPGLGLQVQLGVKLMKGLEFLQLSSPALFNRLVGFQNLREASRKESWQRYRSPYKPFKSHCWDPFPFLGTWRAAPRLPEDCDTH